MDTEILMNLIAIFFLVLGNAFFVGSEIALTSARRSRIKQLADTGNKAAKLVQLLHAQPERFYSVTQIGITLVSLALGAIGMVTVSHLFDPLFEALFVTLNHSDVAQGAIAAAHTASYAIAFIIISFLHVVAGELAPKVLAFHKAESLSLAVAWLINGLYKTFSWLIWIMNKSSNGLLWILGQRDLAGHGEGHFSISEDEIRTILSASERNGVLNPEETQMIRGVFDLDEHTVRDAMTPRTGLIAVSKDATVNDALAMFKESRHARYPVYDSTVDEMVGVVNIKELLAVLSETADVHEIGQRPVHDIMLPVFLVPETKPLSKMLKEFKRQHQQMAVVIDEWGGTAGIITLEDILEEIVGDYEDECTRRYRLIHKLQGSEYIIDASIRVSELEPAVNFPFPDGGGKFVTLGGLVTCHLDRMPAVGDFVELEGGRLEVMEMEKNRVTKVKFQDLQMDINGKMHLAEEGTPSEVLVAGSDAGATAKSAELAAEAALEPQGHATHASSEGENISPAEQIASKEGDEREGK